MTTPDEIYRALLGLPAPDRLRVVERVIHDIATRDASSASVALVGAWADEADLADEIVESALDGRGSRRLRHQAA
jgi:hypothetical protein